MNRNIILVIICLIPINMLILWNILERSVTEAKLTIENDDFKQAVTVTTYSPTRGQTDDTPDLTASGFKIDLHNPGKHRIIAVSRDLKKYLKFGEKVVISNTGKYDGIWQVEDVMNRRWKNKIDLLIGVDGYHTKIEGAIIQKLPRQWALFNSSIYELWCACGVCYN
jgi:3D (Asp-Asp-Asp) domain-containing protein